MKQPHSWVGGFTLFLLMMAFCVPVTVEATSLWSERDFSDYDDRVAVEPGDLIMIVVSENAQAQSESNREREKDVSVGGEANRGAGGATIINEIASWIPIFGPSISGTTDYEAERQLDAFGSLNTRLSVRVDSIEKGGVLRLRGERMIKLEDEIRNIRFEGVARADDVRPDNTIPSDRIADARIRFEGELGVQSGDADGFISETWVSIKNLLFG